jgi:hypothetical protein
MTLITSSYLGCRKVAKGVKMVSPPSSVSKTRHCQIYVLPTDVVSDNKLSSAAVFSNGLET